MVLYLYPHPTPPPPKVDRNKHFYLSHHSSALSICPCVQVLFRYPLKVQPFVTTLGVVVHHCKAECYNVLWKKWIAIFKTKVTVRALNSVLIKMWFLLLLTVSSELLILLRPNLVCWYEVKILDCFVEGSQQMFKITINVCPDSIFWTTEPFKSKLVLVIHHKPECHAKTLGCYFQGQLLFI